MPRQGTSPVGSVEAGGGEPEQLARRGAGGTWTFDPIAVPPGARYAFERTTDGAGTAVLLQLWLTWSKSLAAGPSG